MNLADATSVSTCRELTCSRPTGSDRPALEGTSCLCRSRRGALEALLLNLSTKRRGVADRLRARSLHGLDCFVNSCKTLLVSAPRPAYSSMPLTEETAVPQQCQDPEGCCCHCCRRMNIHGSQSSNTFSTALQFAACVFADLLSLGACSTAIGYGSCICIS